MLSYQSLKVIFWTRRKMFYKKNEKKAEKFFIKKIKKLKFFYKQNEKKAEKFFIKKIS